VSGQETTPLWPLALLFAAVLGLVAVMIGLSHVLGERHRARATDEPFEGGIVSTGSARLRLSAKFYLLAMFFVIFDLESAFLVAWAVAARELGWPGYIGAVVFMAVLGVALAYLWRIGALDWGTSALMRRLRAEGRLPSDGRLPAESHAARAGEHRP
jgi:NADH-quinone oxidoreductase subunit A